MAGDQIKAPMVANFKANPRVQWTPPLHESFVNVVSELGGPYVATPKAILDKMKTHGLTLRHIKSHLQKYRATFSATRSKNNRRNRAQEDGNIAPLPHMVTATEEMGSQYVYNQPTTLLKTDQGVTIMLEVDEHEVTDEDADIKFMKNLMKMSRNLLAPQENHPTEV